MTMLFLSQLNRYLMITIDNEFVVDQNMDDLIAIHFNITVLALGCRFVAVDVTDLLGGSELNITKNIVKIDIDDSGQLLDAQFNPGDAHSRGSGRHLMSDNNLAQEGAQSRPQPTTRHLLAMEEGQGNQTGSDSKQLGQATPENPATITTISSAKAKEVIQGLTQLGARASAHTLPIRGRNMLDVEDDWERNKDGWETGTATYAAENGEHKFTLQYHTSGEIEIYKDAALTEQIDQGFIQIIDVKSALKTNKNSSVSKEWGVKVGDLMQIYDYKQGRLIGDDNVLQAQKTILESKDYCSANKYCVGFTFQASSRNPVTRVMVTFKNSQEFEQATSQNGLLQDTATAAAGAAASSTLGWHTFLKKSAESHQIVHHAGEQV